MSSRTEENLIVRLLHAQTFTKMPGGKHGNPTCLWGDVGMGKSDLVRYFSATRGFICNAFSLSHAEPPDICTLMPEKRNGRYVQDYALHTTLEECLDGGYRVLFLDEYTQASVPVQAVSMPIVLDRVVGRDTLPPSVIPILASNPYTTSVGGNQLGRGPSNRLTHLDLDSLYEGEEHLEGWLYWLQNQTQLEQPKPLYDPAAEWQRVYNLWDDAFLSATQEVGVFMEHNRDLLQPKLEKTWRPKGIGDYAFPTRRSVAKVAHILASAEIHQLSEEEKQILIAGTVGKSWSEQFRAWSEHYKHLPNIEDFLDGKVEWKHDPLHHDRTLIVLSTCFNVCTATKDRDLELQRVARFWEFMASVTQSDKRASDMLVPTVAKMAKRGWLRGDFRQHSQAVSADLSKVIAR